MVLSYFMDRKFSVSCGDATSGTWSMQAGVPQGSDVGPSLFLVPASDFSDSAVLTASQYADDVEVPVDAANYCAHAEYVLQEFLSSSYQMNKTSIFSRTKQ
uniref:Putative RNA-directed DNA polymerase from transposon BS n=1 Tax=Lygus hesperus TaxID=30085 RepID=A0A0A9ZBA4_LYGHE